MSKIYGNIIKPKVVDVNPKMIALSATEVTSLASFDIKTIYTGDYTKLTLANFICKLTRVHLGAVANGNAAQTNSFTTSVSPIVTYNATTGIVSISTVSYSWLHHYNTHFATAYYIPYLIV